MKLSRLSVRDLEVEAREVEHQIKRIEHHPRPTPAEQERERELKRRRLLVKDRLATSLR